MILSKEELQKDETVIKTGLKRLNNISIESLFRSKLSFCVYGYSILLFTAIDLTKNKN